MLGLESVKLNRGWQYYKYAIEEDQFFLARTVPIQVPESHLLIAAHGLGPHGFQLRSWLIDPGFGCGVENGLGVMLELIRSDTNVAPDGWSFEVVEN